MSEPVVVVSKAGVNVVTDTDPNNKIFDSRYNTFKILSQGTSTYTINAGATGVTKSIAHGQSQKPFVFAFIKWADGLVGTIQSSKKGTLSGFAQIYNVGVDVNGTNIVFTFDNFSGSNESISLAYFVCEAPAQS